MASSSDAPTSSQNLVLFHGTSAFCVVCGGFVKYKTSGRNTCESCTRFFKYCNDHETQMRCLFDDNCEISRGSKTNCRSCRYQKCLAAGMKTDKVLKKGPCLLKKEKPKPFPCEFPMTDEELNEAIAQIIEANERDNEYSKYGEVTVLERSMSFQPGRTPEETRLNAWGSYLQQIHEELWDMISFVRKLPKEDALNNEQRTFLLKNNAFPIFLLRNIHGFSSNGLLLPNGVSIDSQIMILLYGDLYEKMTKFAEKLKGISIIDVYLLIMIVFYTPVPAEQFQALKKHEGFLDNAHNHYKEVLNQKMEKDEDGKEKIEKMIDFFKELDEINESHKLIIIYLNENIKLYEPHSLFLDLFSVRNPSAFPVLKEVDAPKSPSPPLASMTIPAAHMTMGEALTEAARISRTASADSDSSMTVGKFLRDQEKSKRVKKKKKASRGPGCSKEPIVIQLDDDEGSSRGPTTSGTSNPIVDSSGNEPMEVEKADDGELE